VSKKGWAIGVVAFLAIVGSCSDKETTSTRTPAPVAAPTSSSPYVAPVAAPTTSAAARGVALTPGLLRYVSTGYGSDFGESMVVATHTGYGGRDCSDPDYSPSTTEYDVDVDVNDDVNLPDGPSPAATAPASGGAEPRARRS
jgi:hypothetical protein